MKTKKLAKTAAQATPKKGTKRFQSTDGDAGKTSKRHKKSSKTLAAKHTGKRKQQEEKTVKLKAKQRWGNWLPKNDVSGKLLDAEPEREDCVTQTESEKQYDVEAK